MQTQFREKRPSLLSGLQRKAWPLSVTALLAVTAVAGVMSAPESAVAAGAAVLERPIFDRNAGVVLVPYKGAVPRMTTESSGAGTLLHVDFMGSRAQLPAAYRLGVFHPVVSKVEMAADPSEGRVRVTIHATQPSRVNIVPDPRKGLIRLELKEDSGEADTMAADPTPAPAARNLGKPVPPRPMPRAAEQVGMEPLSPPAPENLPQALPSLSPVQQRTGAGSVPGTPSSGEFVYRKAIPGGDGKSVTEVEVRTARQSAIQINQDPRSDAVVVNVTPPGTIAGAAGLSPSYGRDPLPNEPYRLAPVRAQGVYRPIFAIDSVLGFTLMAEKALTFGSDFRGQGATLWGFGGHIPLGPAMSVTMNGESFAYSINSLQVPDAQTKRTEYAGRLTAEYLLIRSPWVLAVGPGYQGRYVQNSYSLLAPATPSLISNPTQLQHGPTLNARTYYPIWDALSVNAEVGLAPYLLSNGDSLSAAIGNMMGFQGGLSLKWSTRHLAVSAGYRHNGVLNYAQSYSFNRGGPEVSLIWRF